MANIDEGAVLGGRYEITGRVMASAQRDQVLTGRDQVLNREVLILVASRENASQAAQSARQLATGERASSIQILDLGLSDDRTYLVAPGNADVEDLLALLTTEDVYVEPFFTEALGTELFGESRSNTPQTFEDDAEYYAELQDELSEEDQDSAKRPEFLNKLSDRIDDWLQDDSDDAPIAPGREESSSKGAGAAAAAGTAAAAGVAASSRDDSSRDESSDDDQTTDDAQHEDQSQDSVDDASDDDQSTESILPLIADEQKKSREPERPADEERTQIVEPITQDQPQQQPPAATPPPPVEPLPPRDEAVHEGPTAVPPPPARGEPTAEEGYAIQYTDERQRSTWGRLLAGLLLIAVLVGAVVIIFQVLGAPDEDDPPVADEPTTQAPAEDEEDEPTEEETEEPAGPEPVPASVERVVPDSPGLSNGYDADLPAIVDGNQATAWHTLTFTSPQFGGFASNLALVVELEEQAPVSEVTISQSQGSGGAFTVAVSNEPDPEGGVMLTEGSFTGPEYTVDAHDSEGDPVEARYVIINFTELPTLSNTASADRPYGLRINEIEVN
ncbi:MAG: discoidin domain-containing protein [Micrococcaceae bacterium]|nr:discoidin domain-containing protein [Micrococcaceae bacterium]